MRKYIFLILIFSSIISRAQQNEISDLENKKKEILNQINNLNDSIKKIELTINAIKSNEIRKMISDSTLKVIVRKGAILKKTGSPVGELITTLSEGQEVVVLDYKDGYLGVCSDYNCGFMSVTWIKKNDKIDEFIKSKKVEEKELRQLAIEQKLKDQKEQYAELEKKYIEIFGQETYNKLKKGLYWTGMTREMATISLGSPNDKNRSVGSWGVHEQWVYDNLYLYFENGKLTSYQN